MLNNYIYIHDNKIPELSVSELQDAFPYHPVFIAYRGSKAHGMFVPSTEPNSIDDIDLMGIVVGPADTYFGISKFEHKERFIREYDIVTYEIRKFIRLLCKSNPNVLTILWLDKDKILYRNSLINELIDNRNLFASKEVYKSFVGYAKAQIYKMERANFKGYMGEKRKRLVEKFGYDTKNAAHAIRLLRMGIEFISDGEFYVDRTGRDREQLLSIKNGKYTLQYIKEWAADLLVIADRSLEFSPLPERIDMDKVNSKFTRVLREFWA